MLAVNYIDDIQEVDLGEVENSSAKKSFIWNGKRYKSLREFADEAGFNAKQYKVLYTQMQVYHNIDKALSFIYSSGINEVTDEYSIDHTQSESERLEYTELNKARNFIKSNNIKGKAAKLLLELTKKHASFEYAKTEFINILKKGKAEKERKLEEEEQRKTEDKQKALDIAKGLLYYAVRGMKYDLESYKEYPINCYIDDFHKSFKNKIAKIAGVDNEYTKHLIKLCEDELRSKYSSYYNVYHKRKVLNDLRSERNHNRICELLSICYDGALTNKAKQIIQNLDGNCLDRNINSAEVEINNLLKNALKIEDYDGLLKYLKGMINSLNPTNLVSSIAKYLRYNDLLQDVAMNAMIVDEGPLALYAMFDYYNTKNSFYKSILKV